MAKPVPPVINGKPPNGNWVLRLQSTSSTRTGIFFSCQLALATLSNAYTATIFNLPPVASNQATATAYATATNLVLTGSDPDGDTLTFLIATNPAHGALSGLNTNTGALVYTPYAGFSGTDAFAFAVSDGYTSSPPPPSP